MPTHEILPSFWRDWDALTIKQRQAFRVAVGRFVEDLARGEGIRPGLRVKGVRGAPGIFELTWAPDGRATFSYGSAVRGDEPHIVWRRIGTYDVLGRP
jgi:hypothetical protein